MTNRELCYMTTEVLQDVKSEIQRGENRFGPFHSLHEAIAVLREEYIETENAVFWEAEKQNDLTIIRNEAIQVAAVAIRLAMMLTPSAHKPPLTIEHAEAEVD